MALWKQVINFLRRREYKTEEVRTEGIPALCQTERAEQAEELQKPVRHPKRKARLLLARYGIEKIYTQDDVNRIFWEMALRRKPMNKDVVHAVHVTICDNRLMKSFNRKLELYNQFMQSKSDDPTYKDNEEELRAEVARLKQSLAREEREKNNIRQKLEQEEGMGRRLAKKFMNQLRNPRSKFSQVYDYTKEEDIEDFLSWFKLLKRQVAKRTVKEIIRYHLPDEATRYLLEAMVEAHNSQFTVSEDGDIAEDAGY